MSADRPILKESEKYRIENLFARGNMRPIYITGLKCLAYTFGYCPDSTDVNLRVPVCRCCGLYYGYHQNIVKPELKAKLPGYEVTGVVYDVSGNRTASRCEYTAIKEEAGIAIIKRFSMTAIGHDPKRQLLAAVVADIEPDVELITAERTTRLSIGKPGGSDSLKHFNILKEVSRQGMIALPEVIDAARRELMIQKGLSRERANKVISSFGVHPGQKKI